MERGKTENIEKTEKIEFKSLNVRRHPERFNGRRREAWKLIYGTERSYSEEYSYDTARRALREPESVVEAFIGGESCGVLELNYERESYSGAGCVSFVYLDPPYRGRGLGRQLLDYAEEYYRRRGRVRLRLRVAEPNVKAREFYRKNGFTVTDVERGSLSLQYVMERKIGRA